MINDVVRILRWSVLDKQINRIKEILRKKEKELNELQCNCKHEVIVFTEEECCYGGYDDNLHQKCLFCGTRSASRRSFRESKYVIDVSKFKEENLFSKETKFNIVKDLFIKFSNEHPDFSTEKIVDLVIKDLETQNEEFRKLMEQIYKK